MGDYVKVFRESTHSVETRCISFTVNSTSQINHKLLSSALFLGLPLLECSTPPLLSVSIRFLTNPGVLKDFVCMPENPG